MAYLPLLDILKAYFDIKEDDREYIIKKKIAEKMLHLDERLAAIQPSCMKCCPLKLKMMPTYSWSRG